MLVWQGKAISIIKVQENVATGGEEVGHASRFTRAVMV